MSCKDCEKSQDEGWIAYYRWGKANIGMIGCRKHVREIFEVLKNSKDKNEKKN